MKKTFMTGLLLLAVTTTYTQTIQQARLDSLLAKAEHTHSEAVIVYKDNQLVTEKYFGIGKPGTKIESMSCTKSVVGLAVACLLNDGLIANLDVPVCTYYPEWRQGQKKDITIRHLVNMTSGIQNNPNASVEIYPSPNFVQLALAAELSNQPGEVWSYNNKSLNLVAGLVKKITGKRMDVYIGQRLFKPLEIKDYSWSLDSAGNPHVMSGCQLKPADFIKIGLLVLNKGQYKNKQVIAEKYIHEVTSPCTQYAGYGMLWWIDHETTISTVDDEVIDALKKAGLADDFVQKAEQLKGTYDNDDAFYGKIETVFGQNPWEYINQAMGDKKVKLRKKTFKGKTTYRADGYLGNYIVVDPETKIVAIRMISHQSFKDEKDNFLDFRDLVTHLAE